MVEKKALPSCGTRKEKSWLRLQSDPESLLVVVSMLPRPISKARKPVEAFRPGIVRLASSKRTVLPRG